MNKGHAEGCQKFKNHGLKPEADKYLPSKRQKTELYISFLCRRDTGNLSASGFNPWRLYVVVLLAAFASAASVHATPASQPMTVKDYFLRLPPRYFEMTNAARKEAYFGRGGSNLTGVLDVKNDYFYAAGNGAQAPLTVALFRYRGIVTVAVLDGGYDPNIPTRDFLRYRSGHWMNVTRRILPLPFDDRLAYFLPRRGTIVRVRNSRGRTACNLLWKQGRFFVGRPQ